MTQTPNANSSQFHPGAAAIKRRQVPWHEILGFAIFDFANSSYTTVIITVVYVNVFWKFIVGDEKLGNFYWALALGISYLCVVISAPLLGAIMDFTASKKRFLFASYLITVLASCALYFVSPASLALGMALVALSNFGFASGENIVSSFLPELGKPEDLGRISGYAWGLGYFGGILSMLVVIGLTGSPADGTLDDKALVGPITGIFFMLAAIPTFLLLKEHGRPREKPPGESIWTVGFSRLRTTIREISVFRDLAVFLVSYFFAYCGLAIVISFTFVYGEQVIKWDRNAPVIMFLLTNLAAAAGAVVFGFVQDRWGDKFTYGLTLVIWIVAVLLIFKSVDLTNAVNRAFDTALRVQTIFIVVCTIAGMCLGATQSASRAVVGVFSPISKSGESFGLWGLSTKAAAGISLITFGTIQTLVGPRLSILLCAVFFAVAFVINFYVNEERGKRVAREREGE